ncbi:MAG TPA: transposase [Candidatus Gastranaerophilales bacterium]|nr:transposase [Candidatus Gastranaerophilales bacterium]
MSDNNLWVDLKTIAEIKQVTSRALRIALSKGKYIFRETKTQGGKSYEILLSSLEPQVQEVYKNTYYREIVETVNHDILLPIEKPVQTESGFIPAQAKTVALAKVDLIQEWIKFRNKHSPKHEGDKLFLDLYNSGEYLKNVFRLIGKTSRGSLLRWNKLYSEYENWEALVPQYHYTNSDEYKTTLTEEEIGIFLKLLLHPNQFSIGKAIKLTTHILEKKGIEDIPKPITFRRYAEYFRRQNYDKWILMREGEKALRDKVEPYLSRDISKIEVGDVLVADGHRLNFLVLNPFTGRPCRAVIVAFLDWKSGYLCGYEIMLEENTQCIASALRMAIINLDMIPRIVYQDNGKAFKAKYFSKSTDFTEAGFSGIYTKLGIKPVYAKPYNARAKVIERFFKEFQEEFEKLLPTYTGSNIANKPAHMKRNEKLHKELYDKINQGYIPTVEETIRFVDAWLSYRHSQPCPNDRTMSIKQVFEGRIRQNIGINELDELMMAHEVKTINRNGIRFLNTDYNSDALYGLRDRVMIRYSLFNLSKIKVYSTRGEYLCTAKRVTGTHPMAYHLGDIKDREDFIQKIKKPAQLRNRTLRTIKKYLPKEDIKFLETQMIEETIPQEIPPEGVKKEPIAIPEKLRPVFLNNYERYEWLMENGCTSAEERKWLQNYKNSDEFRMIYGE